MAWSRKEIWKQQSQTIGNLLDSHKFTDVTFVVGANQEEFEANRVFLSSISPVFEAMLYGSMKESKPNTVIPIVDIEPEAFKTVIDFAYCKPLNITMRNVVSVKTMCDKYQINAVSQLCDQYVACKLNKNNLCALFNDAVRMKLDDYVTRCQRMIKNKFGEHFAYVINTQGFKKLSSDAMRLLLAMDCIEIKEKDLFEGLLQWADYQSDMTANDGAPSRKKQKLNDAKAHSMDLTRRNNLVKPLRHLIRFGLISSQSLWSSNNLYFARTVKQLGILTNEELLDIFTYFHDKEAGCGKFLTVKRKFNPDTIVIKRGIINDNGTKHRKKKHHALCITTNQDIQLRFIGGLRQYYGFAPQTQCVIYEGDNGPGNKKNIVGKGMRVKKKARFFPMVQIKANVKYTIEITADTDITKNHIHDGQRKVKVNGLEVTFSKAAVSDGTDSTTGAFPKLYFVKNQRF
eukprot:92941_1